MCNSRTQAATSRADEGRDVTLWCRADHREYREFNICFMSVQERTRMALPNLPVFTPPADFGPLPTRLIHHRDARSFLLRQPGAQQVARPLRAEQRLTLQRSVSRAVANLNSSCPILVISSAG